LTVDSLSNAAFIAISHPTLGGANGVTRVVVGPSDDLYIGATLGTFNAPLGAALYRLQLPTVPIVTWEEAYRVDGVTTDLIAFGNVLQDEFEASEFLLDGTVAPLAHPPGPDSNNGTSLSLSTPSGYAIGIAGIPGTAGIGPVKWEPDGDISFLGAFGVANSIRDRTDGEGANIGWYDFEVPVISYGDGDSFGIFKDDGASFYDDFPFTIEVNVSHGDFAVVEVFESFSSGVSALYGFYPGIVPGFDNRGLPLLDIFPQLAAIDIDRVHDLASVDGYLYMTLSGADGTYLFGERDPSVIPEPAAVVMVLCVAVVVLPRRGRRPKYAGAEIRCTPGS
jgi:hypothetical protein